MQFSLTQKEDDMTEVTPESSFRKIMEKIESLNDPEANGYCEQDAYEEQDDLAGLMMERLQDRVDLYDAAPEMLEELRGWIAIFQRNGTFMSPLVMTAVRSTLAVIAKAEGKTV
jgi:hypothetical protein